MQWGGWEGMNKPGLQLNLYNLISCSCWDAVALHVSIQLFFGEGNQRVDSLPLHTLSQGQNSLLRCRLWQPWTVLCADTRDNPWRALLSKKEHSWTCTVSVKPLFCMYNFSLIITLKYAWWRGWTMAKSWRVHVYVGGAAGSTSSTESVQPRYVIADTDSNLRWLQGQL